MNLRNIVSALAVAWGVAYFVYDKASLRQQDISARSFGGQMGEAGFRQGGWAKAWAAQKKAEAAARASGASGPAAASGY